jgi:release factor glutamine methyltransferase
LTAGCSPDIGSLLDWGKEHLKKSGIGDFDVSAEALLRNILNLSRAELLLNPEKPVIQDKIDEYKSLIFKRAKLVPLQYLIGHVEFYNVIIKCDQRALIPRPETEVLVDIVLGKLKNLKTPRILDIGTGSGNIAIAMAKNIADGFIVGIDISKGALDLARENAVENDVQKRTEFFAGDIFDRKFMEDLDVFDCIVSNPPYVAESERDGLQAEVIEYEPEMALISPGDPLRFFKTIIGIASGILKPRGLLAFEVGLGQAETVKDMMSPRFKDLQAYKDLSGIDRVVIGTVKG